MAPETPTPAVNLLIVGTGMYVSGRGTASAGTVLPAVLQAHRAGRLGRVLVATRHAASFTELDAQLERLATALGTRLAYEGFAGPTGWLEALRALPEPGAVIVVTPDHLHAEMAAAAIEHRRHVLVVKPLAPTVAEARALVRAVVTAGVHGAVELHKRWDLANLLLRDTIHGGAIGEPLTFHVEYSQRKVMPTRIFAGWVDRTSVFQYLGVHYADIIHFVTGATPRRLVATAQRRWLAARGIDTPDAIQALVEWSSGFTSTLSTSWVDPDASTAMSQQKITVVGTGGRLESDQTERGVRLVTDDGGVEEVNPYFCRAYGEPGSDAFSFRGYGIDSVLRFIDDVSDIAAGQVTPADLAPARPTFRSALVSTAVVEGVATSLAGGGAWVEFAHDLTPTLAR